MRLLLSLSILVFSFYASAELETHRMSDLFRMSRDTQEELGDLAKQIGDLKLESKVPDRNIPYFRKLVEKCERDGSTYECRKQADQYRKDLEDAEKKFHEYNVKITSLEDKHNNLMKSEHARFDREDAEKERKRVEAEERRKAEIEAARVAELEKVAAAAAAEKARIQAEGEARRKALEEKAAKERAKEQEEIARLAAERARLAEVAATTNASAIAANRAVTNAQTTILAERQQLNDLEDRLDMQEMGLYVKAKLAKMLSDQQICNVVVNQCAKGTPSDLSVRTFMNSIFKSADGAQTSPVSLPTGQR